MIAHVRLRSPLHYFCGTFVLLCVLYPRVSLVGGFPATDEGIYAFSAQLIHDGLVSGQGLPDHGPLQLYPILVSWVFSLQWNHLLMLRLVDMAVALAVGWQLFRLTERESGSLAAGALIAGAFSFAMNQHVFIQNGFKNSMFAAYIPLLLAARIGLDSVPEDKRRWYACGGLVALAVLLRESFVSFAILGWLAILFAHGWKSCLRYTLGGIFAGAALIVTILALRGGTASILASYFEMGRGYSSMDDLRWPLLASACLATFREASFALVLGLAGAGTILLRFVRPTAAVQTGRWLFWVAVALVPLLEPILKIGFPFHLAVSFIGLCGLASLGWRGLAHIPPKPLVVGTSALAAVSLFLAAPQFGKLHDFFRDRTAVNWAAFPGQSWPEQSVARSNYLLLSKAIQDFAPAQATLSVSGVHLVLFPLSGLLPPTYELSDLSNTVLVPGMDESGLREAIRACPPDLIVLTARTDIPGRQMILQALSEMPEYSEVAKVPTSPVTDYGHFGASVHLRKPAKAPCATPLRSKGMSAPTK